METFEMGLNIKTTPSLTIGVHKQLPHNFFLKIILSKYLKNNVSYYQKFQKFKLQEFGIKPWISINKHISCEQTNHKDNKKTLNLNFICKFIIC